MRSALCLFLSLLIPIASAQGPGPLSTSANLKALNAIVCQFEDGAALGPDDRVGPGESVFFRFDAAGFRTSEAGKVQLTGHVQAFDPRGIAIAPRDEILIGTSLRDEDKDWKPRLRSQFQVPPIAPPGIYRIHFDVTDELSHEKAAGDTSFSVAGRDVRESAVLAIRDLAFYRAAEEAAALKAPVYARGDTVWLRFDVTGYKFGEQNAIDVSYDVAVATATGKQLFSQENAATEKSQAFYPQPWVPGSFSLTLQRDTLPGIYTVSVTAHDGVSNLAVTEKAEFRVE